MPSASLPGRFRRDTLLVFCLLAFAYGYFQHDSGWNGNSRLGLVLAVVHEHRLAIDSFHAWPPTQTSDKASYGGHYYSDKAIGVALLGALVYFPISLFMRLLSPPPQIDTICHALTFVVIGLPSALAGSLLYSLCRDMSGSRVRALLVTLAYGLGTMAFAYSALLFGHQLAAAFLVIGFFLAWRMKRAGAAVTGRTLFLIGFVSGMALVSDYTSLLIVVPLAVYAGRGVWRARTAGFSGRGGARAMVLATAGCLIPVGLQLANNAICFGSPFRNAYTLHAVPAYREGIDLGLMGIGLPRLDVLFYLTFHPARGIFWQSPVLLAGFAGLAVALRDTARREEAVVALCGVLGYLVVNSGYFCWWGSWTFGPRFLIPMLPFLALPLIFLPSRHDKIVLALTVASIAQMLVYTAQAPLVPADLTDIARRPPFAYWPLGGSASALARGWFGPNLGRILGLSGWASLAPLAVGIAALSWAVIAVGQDEDRSDRGSRRPT